MVAYQTIVTSVAATAAAGLAFAEWLEALLALCRGHEHDHEGAEGELQGDEGSEGGGLGLGAGLLVGDAAHRCLLLYTRSGAKRPQNPSERAR